jgi:hypothetical protein
MILQYICKSEILPKITADRFYILDCPANFSEAHRAPTAETAVKFELRKSDTLDENGIAILDPHNAFLGWIKKEDAQKI